MNGPGLESIDSAPRVRALLHHPLRLAILARSRTPTSATELARGLGETRQKVNYHVRQLARARFLTPAGRQRKRNMVEQRWVASASCYLLEPSVLGALAPRPSTQTDRFAASYLMALCAQTQDELARTSREAQDRGLRLATLAIDAELAFESADQRLRFSETLRAAVLSVIAEHSSPALAADGSKGPGRPYRLILGCHPIPPDRARPPEDSSVQSNPKAESP